MVSISLGGKGKVKLRVKRCDYRVGGGVRLRGSSGIYGPSNNHFWEPRRVVRTHTQIYCASFYNHGSCTPNSVSSVWSRRHEVAEQQDGHR